MKRLRLSPSSVGALAIAVLWSVGPVAAQETNAISGTNYASFRIITERNIFSANRSGRPSRGSRDTPRPTKVDAFALLGTMSYEKGHFAFFDGSSSEYRKTLKPEGTIADFKVLDIGANSVKLDGKGKHFELRVGSQLRREDGGDWKVAADSELPPSSGGGSTATASSGGSGTANQGGGESGSSGSEMSDVLKRLLEQREKETK